MSYSATGLVIRVGVFLVIAAVLYLFAYERPRPSDATSIFAFMATFGLALFSVSLMTPPEFRRALAIAAGVPYPLWGIILLARRVRNWRLSAPRLMLPGIAIWAMYVLFEKDSLVAGLAVGAGFAIAFHRLIAHLQGSAGGETEGALMNSGDSLRDPR